MSEFWQKFRPKEREFKPDDLQNKILSQAAIWKSEGTPWFTGVTIANELEAKYGKTIWTGPLFSAMHSLTRVNALEYAWTSKIADKGPQAVLPPPAEEGEVRSCYYQITGKGNTMRGRLEGRVTLTGAGPAGETI